MINNRNSVTRFLIHFLYKKILNTLFEQAKTVDYTDT